MGVVWKGHLPQTKIKGCLHIANVTPSEIKTDGLVGEPRHSPFNSMEDIVWAGLRPALSRFLELMAWELAQSHLQWLGKTGF